MTSGFSSGFSALRIALITLALATGMSTASRGGYVLVDDFQSYALGSPIDGQGYWEAEAGANAVAAGVAADPLAAGNRVLAIGDGGFTGGRLGHRETINTNPSLRIADGTTATLFFRMAWNSEVDVNLSIGMTEVAYPISDTLFNSFEQFRSQLAAAFSPGYDNIGIRDIGGLKKLTFDVAPLHWYNVWLVIDQEFDTTQIYLQGGAFSQQTLLAYQGTTEFLFRNGATEDDLITLFIATGRGTTNVPPDPTENIGPVYIDDVFIDASGINLTNPVPEPATWALSLAGGVLAGIASCRRSRLVAPSR